MKRDIELSRALLIAMENSESELSTNTLATQRDEPEQSLAYHVLLLEEAGLVKAAILPKSRATHPDAAIMLRLTHAGHEFLDSVRSDTNWNKLKTFVTDTGLELSIGVLKKAIPVFVASAFGD